MSVISLSIDSYYFAMRARQRELMREGMSEEAAEEKAVAEARREIRQIPDDEFCKLLGNK